MGHEVFTGIQAQLTAIPNSHTLEGRGVFPMVDGGNNEIQNSGNAGVPKNGEASIARPEHNPGSPEAPAGIIAVLSLSRDSIDHPLSLKAADVFQSELEARPIQEWTRDDYVRSLAAIQRIGSEAKATASNIPEPQEVADKITEYLNISAGRSGLSLIDVTRRVRKELKQSDLSESALREKVEFQLLLLARAGKITGGEEKSFLEDRPLVKSPADVTSEETVPPMSDTIEDIERRAAELLMNRRENQAETGKERVENAEEKARSESPGERDARILEERKSNILVDAESIPAELQAETWFTTLYKETQDHIAQTQIRLWTTKDFEAELIRWRTGFRRISEPGQFSQLTFDTLNEIYDSLKVYAGLSDVGLAPLADFFRLDSRIPDRVAYNTPEMLRASYSRLVTYEKMTNAEFWRVMSRIGPITNKTEVRIDRNERAEALSRGGTEALKELFRRYGLKEDAENPGEILEEGLALDHTSNLISDRFFGGVPGDPLLDPVHTRILAELNGKDTADLAQIHPGDDTALPGFFRAAGPGTFDALWNHVEDQRSDYIDTIRTRTAGGVHLTNAQVEEYVSRLQIVDGYMDALNAIQLDAAREWVLHQAGGIRNLRGTAEIESEQITAILNRSRAANTLQQRGRRLDTSENGPLRYLLRRIEGIDINDDDASFHHIVDSFARRPTGSGPGQISREAKFFLIEYLGERFLRKMDHLTDVQWEMPVGLYVGGNFDYLEQLAEHEFGKKSKENAYIIRLKDQRTQMHELYRSIPRQDQYKQIILGIGAEGLQYSHDVPGVSAAFSLFEKTAFYRNTRFSSKRHRMLDADEFQKINKEVENRIAELQQAGALRAPSGRVLTKWEAERAFILGRALFGGMQRMGINMGWGGFPASTYEIYNKIPHGGIVGKAFAGKMVNLYLLGKHTVFMFDLAYKLADEFTEKAFKAGKTSKHFIDGVCGISKRIAWINKINAPDFLTNPSRGAAMIFADIRHREKRADGTYGGGNRSLFEVMTRMGERRREDYIATHGYSPSSDSVRKPDDLTPDLISGEVMAKMMRRAGGGKHAGEFEFFRDDVLSQRLYVSWLAQYDNMPRDIREQLFRKIAVLKPDDIVAFYPKLLDHAMRASGTNDAIWEELRGKLVVHGVRRVVDEGREMMSYNQTLRTIRTNLDYHGDEAIARALYNTKKADILTRHTLGTSGYDMELEELREDMKMDFENLDIWQRKLDEELFVTENNFDPTVMSVYDPATRTVRDAEDADRARIAAARYQIRDGIFSVPFANLSPQQLDNLTPEQKQEHEEYKLLTKIIDLSVGVTKVDGTGKPILDKRNNIQYESEPVAKILSEAEIAYKLGLDDMPHVAWMQTGEGMGGLGYGSIRSLYEDQESINEGVGKHLAPLMESPIEHVDEHFAQLVTLVSAHYGRPDAQAMFKPFVYMYALMIKENTGARWGGKWIRDMLRRPNSLLEKYFKAKGLAQDEGGVRNFFAKMANTDVISDEKELVSDKIDEARAVWREHTILEHHSVQQALFDLTPFSRGQKAKDFRHDFWHALTKDNKSDFDKAVQYLGADAAGQMRKIRRRLFQLLLGFIPSSLLKAILPDDVRKPAGI